MTTTLERPATTIISVKDVKPPVGADYSDPSPLVWATETVLRDGWEVTAYRRQLLEAKECGTVFRCMVEQRAERNAELRLVVETDGPIRIAPEGVGQIDGDFYRLSGLLGEAGRRAKALTVDSKGRRVRPGILEILSERIGVTTDRELATALKIEPMYIALGRAGFTPFSDLAIEITAALVESGLARHSDHAYHLAITPAR